MRHVTVSVRPEKLQTKSFFTYFSVQENEINSFRRIKDNQRYLTESKHKTFRLFSFLIAINNAND